MDEITIALSLMRKALEIKMAALGDNHPEFAMAYNNMASLLYGVKEYQEALKMYNKALEISRVNSSHCPRALAATYANKALVLQKIGKVKKPLECVRKVYRYVRWL